jgi:glycosyltransferase involved in cell wall biosynthesis
MISAAAGSLFGPRVDRNLFLTQPPLFFLWGYVLKRLRGQAGYIVLMDLYPEVAIQAGLLKSDSPLSKLLKRLSHFGLRQADGVIVIGRTMRERVLEIGVSPERIHLIPNWADEEAIHPVPHTSNRFRQDQGWQDKFVVLYSGNMGTAHYFDDLLEVCRRMRATKNIIFAFIGQGRRYSEIETFKQAHGLENMVLLPFQPQEKLAETLSAGNLQFVSLQTGYEGLVVPSKIYGILAAGLPTLYQGEAHGEIALMLNEEDAGSVVGFGCAAEMEDRILAYQADPELVARQSLQARELAEGPYSKHSACRRYTAVLNSTAV